MSKARNLASLFTASTDMSTDAEVTAAMGSHAVAVDPHGDRAFTTSSISSHNSATTSVHGIADTAVLATQTYANNAAAAIIPSQTGNTGKYLTTNGTIVSWETIAASGADTVAVIMEAY